VILTAAAIAAAQRAGDIVIDPFDPGRLSPNAYDWRLGRQIRICAGMLDAATATSYSEHAIAAAHAHILLTDTATVTSGLALLSEAAQLAAESGLSHQLRAIEAIRQGTVRPGSIRKGITA
jgi:hypothetical protein